MKKLVLSLATVFMGLSAYGQAPTVDICGEKVDYRLVGKLNGTLSHFVTGLAQLDEIKKTTVCVDTADNAVKQYIIYQYKGTTFYGQFNGQGHWNQ